ncbi:MAG: hypothetical protein V4469_02210 [Patescibacteria group bacterium]
MYAYVLFELNLNNPVLSKTLKTIITNKTSAQEVVEAIGKQISRPLPMHKWLLNGGSPGNTEIQLHLSPETVEV